MAAPALSFRATADAPLSHISPWAAPELQVRDTLPARDLSAARLPRMINDVDQVTGRKFRRQRPVGAWPPRPTRRPPCARRRSDAARVSLPGQPWGQSNPFTPLQANPISTPAPEEEEALAKELCTEFSAGSGSLTPTLRLLIKEQQEVSLGWPTNPCAPTFLLVHIAFSPCRCG